MGYSLVINGRNTTGRSFIGLDGRCIFERHPGKVLLFAHQANAAELDALTGCRIEYFRDMTPAAMLAAAQRIAAREGIDSVATLDERLVEVAAGLRVALGLPGLGAEESRYFRDKVLMKARLQAAGIRVPRFLEDPAARPAEAAALLRECGRLVAKPRDGFGSKDVSFIDTPAQLQAFLEGCPDATRYELEEFIPGTLYHTNSIVEDRRVLQTAIAEYLPGMANIDFGAGTPFVSLMENEGPLHDRLREFSERVIAAFGLRAGVTHLEVFHADDGELVFCEMGIRPGGGGIVHMVEQQLGINLSLAALLAEEGSVAAAAPAGAARNPRRVGLVGIRNASMGIASLRSGDRFEDPWIRSAQILVGDGQLLAPADHCTDMVALFIVEVDGRAEFVERVAELQRRVDAEVAVAAL